MSAKDLVLKPIKSKPANTFVERHHYSGKVVQNSQLHIGVFWEGKLEGVMQFGPSLDKRKIMGLVRGTGWNEFLELNRMAFSDVLPRNSESRAIAVAMRIIRKNKPSIKWVVSFADACQCGDGTIYRASGFVLTGIKKNSNSYKLPFASELDADLLRKKGISNSEILQLKAWIESITPSVEEHPHAHKMSVEGSGVRPSRLLLNFKEIMRRVSRGGASAEKLFRLIGGVPAPGFQLRYIYFLDPAYRRGLTVPEIPFSEIAKQGATMYKGKRADEPK